jgi:hypothetical protein
MNWPGPPGKGQVWRKEPGVRVALDTGRARTLSLMAEICGKGLLGILDPFMLSARLMS